MRFPEGKEEYHDIYPEFNGEHEGMIRHKERSGASAAVMAAVAALTALAALLNLNVLRSAVINPTLLSTTTDSARVEVFSKLDDSDVTYPISYELIPYESDQTPVSSDGKLLLTEGDLSDPDRSPVHTGDIYDPDTLLHFMDLSDGSSYLLIFREGRSGSGGTLMNEALLIPLESVQLKTPAVPSVTPAPPGQIPPVSPPPVTPAPPTISMPAEPPTPTPGNGTTPEIAVPGPTDDTRLFWPGEVTFEYQRKTETKPRITRDPTVPPAPTPTVGP